MPAPRVLVIPGSSRVGSANARLAALAVKELTIADAEVTLISLADYPLPLYGDPPDAIPAPANAVKLKRAIAAHHGVFITTPELNASVPPLLTNALAWVSRTQERNDPPDGVFPGCVFALGAATRDVFGGVRALSALRQILEIGCGALVLPEQIAVGAADQAFGEMDNLKDARSAEQLQALARRLVEMAWDRAGRLT
jgi:NAD(P)H-dependent FMN reductase